MSQFKTISYRFLLVFIIFLICTASIAQINDKEKAQNNDLPLEISEKHYRKDAILKFNEAVKKWELKEIKEAINLWNEAIKIDPKLWIAYLGLGQAYGEEKEFKKALDAYLSFLKLAPKNAPDRNSVTETTKYLSHILKDGEEALKSKDYFEKIKTKHQNKELYVRLNLSTPIKIYFFPAKGIPNYREEFEEAFLEGAKIWKEVLSDLNFQVIKLEERKIDPRVRGDKEKKEKEIIDSAQIKVIFPSRFKIKDDPTNPIAKEIDAQSFPIIRDKKNFRVLGVIMVSPFIYFQSQIAIPLEPLSKLNPDDQIKKLKIIAAREVGHALGLWGFSSNPEDLMFEGEVTELKLSERDKNTIKKLYELDPENSEVLTND